MIILSDAVSGNELRTLQASRRGTSTLAFSSDGKTLASAGGLNEFVKVWELATGTILWEAKVQREVRFLAFSPDGKMLAWSDAERDVQLWEVETGKQRWSFVGHTHPLRSGAFSRDGKRLVTGSHDTTALVWDLAAPAGPVRKSPLSAQELNDLWGDLGGEDAKKAYRALTILAVESSQALPLLKKNLKVVPAADNLEIRQLVTGLDNDRFSVRDDAMQKLSALGTSAEPALRKALSGQPTLETKRRIDELLAKLDPRRSAEVLRDLRALEVLERIGSLEAREMLESVAAGASETRKSQEAKASLKRLAFDAQVALPVK